MLFCVVCVQMCTVLLPTGVNPIAVNKIPVYDMIIITMAVKFVQTAQQARITLKVHLNVTSFGLCARLAATVLVTAVV
jgi:uncharacterized membrane protein